MFYKLAKIVLYVWIKFYYRSVMIGKENIPNKKNGYIVCANHSSGLDPVALGVLFPKRIYPMAKAELFKKWYFILLFHKLLGAYPVKRGEVDLKSIKVSLKYLKDGKTIGIFPEGTRNKTDEIIAEPGVAMLAIKAKVPVVPVSITGKYKFLGGLKLIIGKPILLDEYFDKKLKSEDYHNISIEIMRKIKGMNNNV